MEIINSFTGISLRIEPGEAPDIDALKELIGRNEGIDAQNLFLLEAPSGRQVRNTNARLVFAYDRQWTRNEAHNALNKDDRKDGLSNSKSKASNIDIAEKPNVDKSATNGIPENCIKAANLVKKNLQHSLDTVSKVLEKQKHAKIELQEDIAACGNWRRYYAALEQIPELNAELPTLLNVHDIEHKYAELLNIWEDTLSKLSELNAVNSDLQTRISKITVSVQPEELSAAQEVLLVTLYKVGLVQLRIRTDLKKPLSALVEQLKRVEELKLQVAQVIDLPFLYGALLIEHARRTKWKNDFGPILQREFDRRKEWLKHYGSGSVGTIVQRLDRMGELHIMDRDDGGETDVKDILAKNTSPNETTKGDVMTYLQTLEALNLDEVHKDLLTELGAMKRQLAKSMSASISSLAPDFNASTVLLQHGLPQNVLSQNPLLMAQAQAQAQVQAQIPGSVPPVLASASMSTAPIQASTIAAYESRIRKLETLLMNKMSSKSHEIDIIRAETRAEARAEARAEVKAEQQDMRIAELERQNSELASRIQQFNNGLEAALNSMGLQTSRNNLENGSSGGYQVNRVKGISRKAAGLMSDEASENGSSRSRPVSQSGSNLENQSRGTTGAASAASALASASGSGSGSASESTSGSGSGSASGSATVSHNSQQDASSSHTTDVPRSVSIERILEQTYVDNQVLFDAVSKRFGDVERLARKLQIENRKLRDRDMKLERELRQRVALHSFRAEDLILFLPTRDPRRHPNPWAAFNAGAPHYFLHPKHAEQLENREYLIARASSIEHHVSGPDTDNIFHLPNGVEWFLISIYGEWGV